MSDDGSGGRNLLIGVGFIASIFVVASFFSDAPSPVKGASPASRSSTPETISRADFMARCRVGGDYVDCTAAVGKPDRTQGGSSSIEYFYYDRRTHDPLTSKIDRNAQVVIERGWVRAIHFY